MTVNAPWLETSHSDDSQLPAHSTTHSMAKNLLDKMLFCRNKVNQFPDVFHPRALIVDAEFGEVLKSCVAGFCYVDVGIQ